MSADNQGVAGSVVAVEDGVVQLLNEKLFLQPKVFQIRHLFLSDPAMTSYVKYILDFVVLPCCWYMQCRFKSELVAGAV